MNKFIIGLFDQFKYSDQFKLFDQFKYDVIDKTDGISFFKHLNYNDFWIVVNAEEKFELEEQKTIAEKAKTIFAQYKEAEKNTSLLILLQVKQISEDILDAIVEIENDPFYFKKYVLAYTRSSKEAIEEYGIEDFSSILMQPENFQALKNETELSGPYHLLYSIAHKLPFLMTNVQVQDTTLLPNHYTPSEELQDAFNWMQSIDSDAEDLTKEILDKFENLINTEDGTI